MNDVDAAYLAGLLDGEGCIQARAQGAGGWIRPSIEVCMTNPAPLKWAAATTNIGSVFACRPDRRGLRRLAWKWIITKPSAARSLLRSTVDYMHVKRGEALAFIALTSIRATTPPGRRRLHPDAEHMTAKVIATLKGNGGEVSEQAYQEALDLAVYLRKALFERDGR